MHSDGAAHGASQRHGHHAGRMDSLDLKDALRRETRDLVVETEALILRVLESEADGYAAFLTALRSLHLSARDPGSQLRPDVPSFSDLDLKSRLELLERDLTDLGVPLEPATVAGPELRTPAEVLGLLYSLEDSTPGGTTAARRVRALWNVLGRGNPPLRYLSSEGLDVGARWRVFVRCIAEFSAAHPHLHNEVIGGARRAYAELDAHLSRALSGVAAGAPA